MWWSQRGHKWRHSMVHTHWMLDKQGYMHGRACTRPRPRKYVIVTAFLRQQWFADAPQYYILRTLSLLCFLSTKFLLFSFSFAGSVYLFYFIFVFFFTYCVYYFFTFYVSLNIFYIFLTFFLSSLFPPFISQFTLAVTVAVFFFVSVYDSFLFLPFSVRTLIVYYGINSNPSFELLL
jgi:hypothetical protein